MEEVAVFLLRRNEGRENMYVFHVTVIYTVDISIEWAFVRTKCFGMSVLLDRKCSPIKLNAFVGAQRTGANYWSFNFVELHSNWITSCFSCLQTMDFVGVPWP